MSDPLFNLLKEKQRPSEYVFINPDQEQISRGQLQAILGHKSIHQTVGLHAEDIEDPSPCKN